MDERTWKLPEEWAKQERPVAEEVRMKNVVFWTVNSLCAFLVTLLIISVILLQSLNSSSTLHSIAAITCGLSILGILCLTVISWLLNGVVGDGWSKDGQ